MRCWSRPGGVVQDYKQANIHAGRGVVLRNFPLTSGYGFADYLLYVDGKAAGVIEAKKEGVTLTGVEIQAEQYSKGLRQDLPAITRPLPFLYQSTGVETRFTNGLDPQPRSRSVFSFHRPEIFATWAASIAEKPRDLGGASLAAETTTTLRGQLRHMPPLSTMGLWPAQITAISESRKVAGSRPSSRLDPNGHRQRQDLHRYQLHLSADQVRQARAACSSSSIAATSATRRSRNSSSTSRPTTTSSSPKSSSSSGWRATPSIPPRGSASAPSSACIPCSRGGSYRTRTKKSLSSGLERLFKTTGTVGLQPGHSD